MNRLIIVFFFISGNLFAQNKPMLGISFSPNYDSYIHVPGERAYFYNTQKHHKGDFGFTSGVHLTLPIHDKIDLETGILYTERKYKWVDFEDDDVTRVYYKGNISGLEVPLNALVYLNKTKNLYLKTGLGVSYSLNEKTIYTDEEPSLFIDPDDNMSIIEISLKGFEGHYYFNSHYTEFLTSQGVRKFNSLDISFSANESKKNFNSLNLVPHLGLGLKLHYRKNSPSAF